MKRILLILLHVYLSVNILYSQCDFIAEVSISNTNPIINEQISLFINNYNDTTIWVVNNNDTLIGVINPLTISYPSPGLFDIELILKDSCEINTYQILVRPEPLSIYNTASEKQIKSVTYFDLLGRVVCYTLNCFELKRNNIYIEIVTFVDNTSIRRKIITK